MSSNFYFHHSAGTSCIGEPVHFPLDGRLSALGVGTFRGLSVNMVEHDVFFVRKRNTLERQRKRNDVLAGTRLSEIGLVGTRSKK